MGSEERFCGLRIVLRYDEILEVPGECRTPASGPRG